MHRSFPYSVVDGLTRTLSPDGYMEFRGRHLFEDAGVQRFP